MEKHQGPINHCSFDEQVLNVVVGRFEGGANDDNNNNAAAAAAVELTDYGGHHCFHPLATDDEPSFKFDEYFITNEHNQQQQYQQQEEVESPPLPTADLDKMPFLQMLQLAAAGFGCPPIQLYQDYPANLQLLLTLQQQQQQQQLLGPKEEEEIEDHFLMNQKLIQPWEMIQTTHNNPTPPTIGGGGDGGDYLLVNGKIDQVDIMSCVTNEIMAELRSSSSPPAKSDNKDDDHHRVALINPAETNPAPLPPPQKDSEELPKKRKKGKSKQGVVKVRVRNNNNKNHKKQRNDQVVGAKVEVPLNRSSAQIVSVMGKEGTTVPAMMTATGRKKRKRSRPVKNKEEMETQRMTHIAVERNRRRQMNDHLNSLRSLMPQSYIQRGDQASIIGGAIDFVKELEQLLESLQAQKRMRHHLSPDESNNNGEVVSVSGGAASSSSTGSSSSNLLMSNLFSSPPSAFQPITTATLDDNNKDYNDNDDGLISAGGGGRKGGGGGETQVGEFTAENRSQAADVAVVVIHNHANLKVQCERRSGQLVKAILALEEARLSVLHLNVTSLHSFVNYSFNLKVEDDCKLRSADEIATAVHQIFNLIDQLDP